MEASGDATGEDTSPGDAGAAREGPGRKRRRRRRGRGRGGAEAATGDAGTAVTGDANPHVTAAATPAASSPPPRSGGPQRNGSSSSSSRASSRGPSTPQHDIAPAPRPPSRDAAAFASLTAGLFSHLDDRQVPCKLEGCARTWTWTAAEQIESFGQPPPKRMCAEHHATMHAIEDREIRCSNPSCQRTWMWTKSAQLGQLQKSSARRDGADAAPSRPCDHCVREERELGDSQIPCRVDGCSETWTWTRDAQLKHRAWMRHAPPGVIAPSGDRPRGKRRRRARGNAGADGPPPRMCESCRQRLGALVDRETPCKVHGCTRTVTIDRESQLRAWVAAGPGAVIADVALPKRMCEVCREFCRLHSDREVACGRPGCDLTWTYKTGAQLQAFLAGRFEDPLRLCASCVASGHARPDAALEGVDVMPCIVPMCGGIWHYVLGMEIAACDDGDQPLDRMCNACRSTRGADPRPLVEAPSTTHGESDTDHAPDDENAQHGDGDDQATEATDGAPTDDGPTDDDAPHDEATNDDGTDPSEAADSSEAADPSDASPEPPST